LNQHFPNGLGCHQKLCSSVDPRSIGTRAKGESVRQLARIVGVSKATIGRIPAVEF
jgi:hypothetical protein